MRLNAHRLFTNVKLLTGIYHRTSVRDYYFVSLSFFFHNFLRERDGIYLLRNTCARVHNLRYTYGCSFADCAIAFNSNEEIAFSPRLDDVIGHNCGIKRTPRNRQPLNASRSMIYLVRVRFLFSWLFFYSDSHTTHRIDSATEMRNTADILRKSSLIRWMRWTLRKFDHRTKFCMRILLGEILPWYLM